MSLFKSITAVALLAVSAALSACARPDVQQSEPVRSNDSRQTSQSTESVQTDNPEQPEQSAEVENSSHGKQTEKVTESVRSLRSERFAKSPRFIQSAEMGGETVSDNAVSKQDSGQQETSAAAVPAYPARITNSVGMELALIPAGTFMMGSPESEPGHAAKELLHKITFSHPFYMSVTEVTQAQYEAVMGKNPSKFRGDRYPVENVSWYDAAEFCRKLSEKEGKTYHLPTEAQWEYACRAGTTTPFSFGNTINTDQVNYHGKYVYGKGKPGRFRGRTVAADAMPPNQWGLIGMHGNVQEWCADWYDQDYYEKSPSVDPPGPASGRLRVLRGGNYVSYPVYCRSAHRFSGSPGHKFMTIGFRVVLELSPDS